MINLFPEPKQIVDKHASTAGFAAITMPGATEEQLRLAQLRFWNYPDIVITTDAADNALIVVIGNDPEGPVDNELFVEQGYTLKISAAGAEIKYIGKAGYINAVTSLKMLIKGEKGAYTLPMCEIVDYPSVAVRAVAPTFSWYAGYGRIGFDSQLWGYDEWVEFMNVSLDNKINQFNMVMYGYWPFEFEEYPETVFRDIPVKIWNAENRRWLTVRYTHPNIE